MDPSAYSIDEFCDRYRIGRTTVYEEIKAGRLKAVKVRRRTLVRSFY
jgi:excisionase family DNA binding protein